MTIGEGIKVMLGLLTLCLSADAGEGWSEGIPIAIQKTDWSTLHLTFVQTSGPVSNPASCTANNGFVIRDDNPSAKQAVAFAMTALASGMKFQCYVTNECSTITGHNATYPVCGYYPTIKQ